MSELQNFPWALPVGSLLVLRAGKNDWQSYAINRRGDIARLGDYRTRREALAVLAEPRK